MNLIAALLQLYTPEFVKKMALTELFEATADAFEADVPPLAGLASQAALAQYAQFARSRAEERLRDGREIEVVRQRMYRNAFAMGQRQRALFRPGSAQDVMAVGRLLYRILDIDLQGDQQGEVVIRRCYFSTFYSPDVCRLMSAMDRGLFAGLSNGGQLTFSSRITEGEPCCLAHLNWEGLG